MKFIRTEDRDLGNLARRILDGMPYYTGPVAADITHADGSVLTGNAKEIEALDDLFSRIGLPSDEVTYNDDGTASIRILEDDPAHTTMLSELTGAIAGMPDQKAYDACFILMEAGVQEPWTAMDI